MRVTKKHIKDRFTHLLKLLGKREAESSLDMGAYRLTHNQYYGWNIEEIINDSGGVSHPFGLLSLSGRELYIALGFACRALQRKEKDK